MTSLKRWHFSEHLNDEKELELWVVRLTEEQWVFQSEGRACAKALRPETSPKDADKAGPRESVAWEEAAEVDKSQFGRAALNMEKSL